MAKDYNTETQKLFLEIMITDPEMYVRIQNIYNNENFDRALKDAAKFISQHSNDYKSLPSREQVQAVTGVELRVIDNLDDGTREWFLKEFEGFSRRRTGTCYLEICRYDRKGRV
jgi:hypothetical protein